MFQNFKRQLACIIGFNAVKCNASSSCDGGKSNLDEHSTLLRRVFLRAALRAAQASRYLIYSEADLEGFRPSGATRCTDWGATARV